ncbi:Histidine kinase [Lentibacillus sp. JNUCC-1]|uniref:HAMP domain-containing sensor histidine kinase n=1 Tax=Lentibacillus sp. JNUCC-1 TaxID=2654513 RepID=UPI001324B25B|nr:HAMP domain-containing histidine kinase [Lentibacillus sp. JNUCC-1]MUV37004.1 Histidine kinase [Lentibacillus sp. JNUCC-1]
MLILFLAYSVSQYVIIQNWAMNQETESIQKKMEEVTAYIEGMPADRDVAESAAYLEVLNEEDQTIRVIGDAGVPVVTVADDDVDEWLEPKRLKEESLEEVEVDEELLLVFRMPVERDGFSGTVEITRDIESYESLFEQIGMLVLVTGIVAIVLSFIGGRLISFQLLRPIHSMIAAMKNVKQKGLQERVPVKSNRDEMAELGMMFNELMDNLERAFQQQQQFVEDASHELKTPLTVIHGHLSLIQRWGKENPEVLERSIQLSLNETDRLTHLVSELLTLTKGQDDSTDVANLENIPVKQKLETVIENYQLVHSDFEIRADLGVESGTTLKMVQNHFEQMMIIVLDNAINYSEDEKVIDLKARQDDGRLVIEVTDYGIGIPESEIPFVFRRFYRVDKSRSRKQGGNGLGLAIVKRLVETYGGTIEIDSEYEEWTTVRIAFPS